MKVQKMIGFFLELGMFQTKRKALVDGYKWNRN